VEGRNPISSDRVGWALGFDHDAVGEHHAQHPETLDVLLVDAFQVWVDLAAVPEPPAMWVVISNKAIQKIVKCTVHQLHTGRAF